MKTKYRKMEPDEYPDGYWGDQQFIKGTWLKTKLLGRRPIWKIRKRQPSAEFRTTRKRPEGHPEYAWAHFNNICAERMAVARAILGK